MVISKQELLKLVRDLPESIDVDDLMHKLWLQAKLERSEQDIREGRTLSHAAMVAEVQQWRK
jgi:hypothetical protein